MKYQPKNLELAKSLFEVTELDDPRDDTDELLERAEVLWAPLGFPVDEEKLDRCPALRALISNTTSIPHIDHEAASRHGVEVCALDDEQDFLETITPTAEHAMGLLMAAWRKIPAAHRDACSGNWDRRNWGAPRMLSRMRMGIIGYGRLGKKVAKVARALGMEVAYYDPGMEGSSASLNELASHSDVLSLHASSTEQNRCLVSREVLEALPRGAVVINTARGELLDTDALLELLESGHLAAAALDTIDGEYFPGFAEQWKRHPVAKFAREHDNLLLTPHIGGSTLDAWSETERRVILKAADKLGLTVKA